MNWPITFRKDKNGREVAFRVKAGAMYRIGLEEAKLLVQTGQCKETKWEPITRLKW